MRRFNRSSFCVRSPSFWKPVPITHAKCFSVSDFHEEKEGGGGLAGLLRRSATLIGVLSAGVAAYCARSMWLHADTSPSSTKGLDTQTIHTKHVIAFTDGLSFVVKQGTVDAKDGTCALMFTNNPLFGSLRFMADGITGVTSGRTTVEQDVLPEEGQHSANTFLQLLKLNVSKQVTITTTDGDVFSGVIAHVDDVSGMCQVQSTRWGKHSTFVNGGNIKNLSITGSGVETTLKKKRNVAAVTVHFDQPGKKTLTISFLQRGLSWSPAYFLDVLSMKRARLVLTADVVNHADDLRGAEVQFAVGTPNFEFAQRGEATLTSFSRPQTTPLQASPPQNRRMTSSQPHTFANQEITWASARGGMSCDEATAEEEAVPDLAQIVPDTSGEFFMYTVNNVTLPKTHRGTFTLLKGEVDIEQSFKCHIQDTIHGSYTKIPAQHLIRLKNNSSTSLMSAPLFITEPKLQRALGQCTLPHTAPGNNSIITLAAAPDVYARERITSGSLSWLSKKVLDKSKSHGEITITNTKDEPVTMVLTKDVRGEVSEMSMPCTQQLLTSGGTNDLVRLTLSLSLEPKESKIFSYDVTRN